MNARSSSRVHLQIELCAVLVVLTLFTSGCSFFRETEKVDTPTIKMEMGAISARRSQARKANKTLLCLIAEQGSPFSEYDDESGLWQGAEPEIVRTIGKKLNMDVVFIPVPYAALASALRNGRGDLAVGKLTTSRIATLHQTAVFPYAPVQNEHYALMIRSDDLSWKRDLEKAAAGINGAALLKGNEKNIKPAAVEIVEKESNDEVITISVDLDKKKEKKAPEKK